MSVTLFSREGLDMWKYSTTILICLGYKAASVPRLVSLSVIVSELHTNSKFVLTSQIHPLQFLNTRSLKDPHASRLIGIVVCLTDLIFNILAERHGDT